MCDGEWMGTRNLGTETKVSSEVEGNKLTLLHKHSSTQEFVHGITFRLGTKVKSLKSV